MNAAAAPRLIPLKTFVLRFLDRCRSDHTRDSYRTAILEFQRFIARHLLTASAMDLAAWRDHLLARGKSDQTVAARLSALRSFYKFLQDAEPGLIDSNPVDINLVAPPSVSHKVKGRVLKSLEVRNLLAGPDQGTATGARDYVLMLVMLRLGMRVSDLAAVRTSNITTDLNRCSLRLSAPNSQQHEWPIPPDVVAALERYLFLDDARRSLWRENRDQDQFIFQPTRNHRTGRLNRGLTRHMIARIVSKWAAFGGIVGPVTPHDLRRTAIMRALEQGRTYAEVQLMSKHRDPKSLMRYGYERDFCERNPIETLSYED